MKSNFIHLAALLGAASTVAAHGYVSSIEVAGKSYPGFNPDAGNAAGLIAWSTNAIDQGYVEASHSPDIICHEGAEPGDLSAEVPAGGTVTVTWSAWPEDHKGPVLDYLANCNGDCTNVDKTKLKFFKIDQDGLDGAEWASDKLIQQGHSWDITIPKDLAAGNYVLRHEIIALHSFQNGPQQYPQCINLKVTGGGTSQPAGVPGVDLYQGNEPGLTVNIWNEKAVENGYEIPGPKLYDAGTSAAAGSSTSAVTSAPVSTSTLIPTSSGTGRGTNTSKTACTPKSTDTTPSPTGTNISHLEPAPTGTTTPAVTATGTPSTASVFYTVTKITTTTATTTKIHSTTKFHTHTVTETETYSPTICPLGQSTVTVTANA